MESLEQDVRYAFRTMRKTPVFTAAVTLTIALAIGANTVIFSVVDAVMLRALPFREPERVLQIAEKNDKLKLANFGASVLNFLPWREQSRSFDEMAAVGFANYTLSGAGEPDQLSGSRISPAPAVTRVRSSLVYGVAVRDPVTYAAVAVVLVQVALVACIVPAGRAASVDPMIVLRDG